MKFRYTVFLIILAGSLFTGCAYRYYIGLHGPSVRPYPDEHEGVTEDKDCLECHDPNDAYSAIAMPHPKFAGCLKCHNDNVETTGSKR